MDDLTERSGEAVPRPDAETERSQAMNSDSEPVAWLIRARKPGTWAEWASICDDGSEAWPLDQGWVSVTRTPLVDCGPAENILPAKYAVSAHLKRSETNEQERNAARYLWLREAGREQINVMEHYAGLSLDYVIDRAMREAVCAEPPA